ncbi:MAG: nitroreductase family protein [Candidatus Thiodiazotropha sp.]
MSYKVNIKSIIPNKILLLFRTLRDLTTLIPNAIYDSYRYLTYSGMNRSRAYKGAHEARITMAYHQIEKGLSLSQPRPGFGVQAIERLIRELKTYIDQYGLVEPATNSIATIRSYIEFNESAGLDMTKLRNTLQNLVKVNNNQGNECANGGVKYVTSKQMARERLSTFDNLITSRHSVRDYTGLPIDDSEIEKAIELSRNTPSVCNRQAWKVHAYTDQKKITELLEIQSGGGGFGEKSSVLLVITCDLERFINVDERYQAWIDGGMFSMSLCLSLHYQGYGTCCLNWSKQRKDDKKLRKATGIKPNEQVIMMMAVGTIPDEFKVAYSPRVSTDKILTIY